MGLQVTIDSHSNAMGLFSVTHDFQSLTVLIDQPADFPLTNQKGFPIIPGHKNFISMSAISFDADDNIRPIHPIHRNCLFQNENQALKIHKNYSQYNCFMECALAQANAKMLINHGKENYTTCYPWYFSFYSKNNRICDPWESNEFLLHFQNTNYDLNCSFCLPDCKHTFYKHKLFVEPIQSCDETNFGVSSLCNFKENSVLSDLWGEQTLDDLEQATDNGPIKETIIVVNPVPGKQSNHTEKSYLKSVSTSRRTDIKFGACIFPEIENTYDSFQKDITYLNIYFDQASILQFKTQASSSWIEYFANVGGVLGLFIGLSIVTIFEIGWVMIRIATNLVEDNASIWKNRLIHGWNKLLLESNKLVTTWLKCHILKKKKVVGFRKTP